MNMNTGMKKEQKRLLNQSQKAYARFQHMQKKAQEKLLAKPQLQLFSCCCR